MQISGMVKADLSVFYKTCLNMCNFPLKIQLEINVLHFKLSIQSKFVHKMRNSVDKFLQNMFQFRKKWNENWVKLNPLIINGRLLSFVFFLFLKKKEPKFQFLNQIKKIDHFWYVSYWKYLNKGSNFFHWLISR